MKRILLFLSLIVLCVCRISFANISANDVVELNNATPGTSKVGLGIVIDANQTATTAAQADATTALGRVNNTTVKFLTSDDTSFSSLSSLAHIRKWTGTIDEGITLGAGGTLQILTISLALYGGGNFAITPDTSSGFDQINLTAAGDNVSLRYIDSTNGWTLLGLGTSDTGKVVAPITPFN